MTRKSDAAAALARVENYYWLHDILRVSLGLPAWAIEWDGGQSELLWRDLSLVLPPLAPYHFEISLGREGERDAYYRRNLRKALDGGKPVLGSLFGFEDFFVPVTRSGKGGIALYFGQFCKDFPDYDALAEAWLSMSGRQSAPGDPEFEAFVSTALKLPVLPEPAIQGLAEFGGLFAAYLRGELGEADLRPRLDRLRRKAFIPHLPHPVWAYQAIGFDRQRPTPWYPSDKLNDWMKEELGLTRLPTTVLAMLPLHKDVLRARVLGRRLLGEAWTWCRRRGEVTPAPLMEEGVVFLSSPKPGQGAAAARAEMRGLAEELREFARSRCGLASCVGVGEPVPAGERLFPSYRQAVLALQMSAQEKRGVLFHDEVPREAGEFSYARLARSGRELASLFEQGVSEPLQVSLDEHVRRVLEFASGRVEVARGQFLATLFSCLEATRRRHRVAEDDLERLARQLNESIESANGMVDLLSRLNAALRRLLVYAVAGAEGGKGLKLQETLHWLGESFHQKVSLKEAARHAGLSVPGFTRAFRRATGSAFLPWLRRRRVAEAERLLRYSPLSVMEIAAQCGFSSSQHLIRAFKEERQSTPEAFRKKRRQAQVSDLAR